jgi:hypothetical protein
MKLWGDVPWEGGPRKVIVLMIRMDALPMLAFSGLLAESLVCGGKKPPKDVWTLLNPLDLGKVVYGSGAGADLRKALAARGYKIRWNQ